MPLANIWITMVSWKLHKNSSNSCICMYRRAGLQNWWDWFQDTIYAHKKKKYHFLCHTIWVPWVVNQYFDCWHPAHYNDIIMSVVASQITSLEIVNSMVYSGTDQRKHQSSASLPFVRGIRWSPVNSLHKRPVTRKMFPFDEDIMWYPAAEPWCWPTYASKSYQSLTNCPLGNLNKTLDK